MHSLLLGIAGVFVLGLGAQWLAWRFRLPSILLLLVFGFLAGPVTGLLNPALLGGDWVFPFVSLAVGIILFEGGLSLRFDEIREVQTVIVRLITVGVLVTWAGAGLAAFYFLGFSVPIAVTVGAVLTVTGPTVVIPLLRHVRPSGRVGAIAKWEGITVDPIGAILAVLVLETVLLLNEPAAQGAGGIGGAVSHALKGLALEAVVGTGAAVIGAMALVLLLRRRLVPDYLQNPLALMVVIAVFAVADYLQHESGLLATTLMGVILANQRAVSVRRIVEFKEDLRVLLISILFIVLSARLEPSALAYLTPAGGALFLVALMLVVRPLAVWLSSLGTRLGWQEQAFLAWLAPRGIVAAAVASLFSFRLAPLYPDEAAGIVPVIFLVIVGTVAVYGLTISPLARWLGLATPDPQGLLFVGAHAWARRLAAAVRDLGFRVLLVDANPLNVREAQRMGLTAVRANILDEGLTDELELSGIGRLLAVTPNEEVNSLAALHFAEVFESQEIFQLAARADTERGELPQHLRGRPLFRGAPFADLTERFEAGADLRTFRITEDIGGNALRQHFEGRMLPLFLVRGKDLTVFAERGAVSPLPDDRVVALVDPPKDDHQAMADAAFLDRLAAEPSTRLDADYATSDPHEDGATPPAAQPAATGPPPTARA